MTDLFNPLILIIIFLLGIFLLVRNFKLQSIYNKILYIELALLFFFCIDFYTLKIFKNVFVTNIITPCLLIMIVGTLYFEDLKLKQGKDFFKTLVTFLFLVTFFIVYYWIL